MDLSNIFSTKTKAPSETQGIAAYDSVEAAPEFTPLPPGTYTARVIQGEYTTTKAGAEAYRMRFEITSGEHAGKKVLRTWTFSPKALPYTKRDLTLFGLTSSAQLLAPFPEPGREYLVRLVVALHRGEDGIEHNDVKRIDLLSVKESPAAAFLLPSPEGEGGPR